MSAARCKTCRCEIGFPGCDDAEKPGTKYAHLCRGCEAGVLEQEAYQAYLKRGGKPFSAWMSAGNGRLGRRIV